MLFKQSAAAIENLNLKEGTEPSKLLIRALAKIELDRRLGPNPYVAEAVARVDSLQPATLGSCSRQSQRSLLRFARDDGRDDFLDGAAQLRTLFLARGISPFCVDAVIRGLTSLDRARSLLLGRCGQSANAHIIADGMRRRGKDDRQLRFNGPTKYSTQTQQGLTSTASAMTI